MTRRSRCPECKESRLAGSYVGGHTVCRKCRRSKAAISDAAKAEFRFSPEGLLYQNLKSQLATRTSNRKIDVEELLGFTMTELRVKFESLFSEGMSWGEFFGRRIHIDHVVPLASFRNWQDKELAFRLAWSLDNLQPLWSHDNYAKGAKMPAVLPHWFLEHPATPLGNHAINNWSNKMSLEESMKELADSNLALAAAQEKLAAAQTAVADKYSEMIAFVAAGGAVATPPAAAAATPPKETAAEKKARIKAEEAAAAAAAKTDDDGFDDDDDKAAETTTLTHSDVKAVLLAVKDRFGDKTKAMELIGKFGYSGIPEVQEKDFKAIYDGAQKLLK